MFLQYFTDVYSIVIIRKKSTFDKYKGTLFFISHDREFESSIATRILEIKEDRIIDFSGNY
jgi:ATPase subunit of ABC transporter with duplicated ATPase domains